jgi:hypothetical protein
MPQINSCMPTPLINLQGRRVGHLLVLRMLEYKPYSKTVWEVRCDCGRTSSRSHALLLSRNPDSTGCGIKCPLHTQGKRKKHDACYTPEYKTWRRILGRCYNPNNPSYARYGGSGLTVSDEWRASFLQFQKDMGPRPVGGKNNYSIERIDNSKGYCKENCKWATAKEQAQNRCTNLTLDTPWGGSRGV